MADISLFNINIQHIPHGLSSAFLKFAFENHKVKIFFVIYICRGPSRAATTTLSVGTVPLK